MAAPNRNVFINCPFDSSYQIFFRAIVYTVMRSGFQPRCALEVDDASENRLEKICNLIAACRYGIHDISRTGLDRRTQLPRFNMPLELGIFIGAKKFGRAQGTKRCTVFDTEPYRYQKFISDIAGQDIHAHSDDHRVLIKEWRRGCAFKAMTRRYRAGGRSRRNSSHSSGGCRPSADSVDSPRTS